jgi:DNA-binding response OmpR family regulator
MYVGSEALERNHMKRRILLVDDEVAVLLTLKAVLEISGFDVDTAASAREGVSKLHTREYHMLITDMRMEHDVAGIEVIKAARAAVYHPAVALLTAFPVAEEDWQEMGADQLLVKPMHTRILLQQIEDLIASHERKLASMPKPPAAPKPPAVKSSAKKPAKKIAAKKAATKPAAKKTVAKKTSTSRPALKQAKTAITKKAPAKKTAKTAAIKKAVKSTKTKQASKPAKSRARS